MQQKGAISQPNKGIKKKKSYRKLIIVGGLISLSVGSLTGCGSAQKENETLKAQIASLESKQQELMTQLQSEQALTKAQKATIEDLQQQVKDQTQGEGTFDETMTLNLENDLRQTYELYGPQDMLIVYDTSVDTYLSFPKIVLDPDRQSLQDQLQKLMEKLSTCAFGGLPITVQEIQEIEGKKIAVINLSEAEGRTVEEAIDLHSEDGTLCWAQNYFQGSAGSACTTGTLANTILQPGFSGEWIDGYKLLYNGQTEGWGHIETFGWIMYKGDPVGTSSSVEKQADTKEAYRAKLEQIRKEVDALDEGYTTYDMLFCADYISKKWDSALNEIYSKLEEQLSATEMESLRKSQREWIEARDDSARSAGDEFKGGTFENVAYSMALGSATKERCYALVERYMK